MVVCDRYLASSIAYGEAQGLDAAWLTEIQSRLPQPSLTLLLDIAPDASLNRKQVARDKFERDLPLLGRVRESYLRQAGRDPQLGAPRRRPRQGRGVGRRAHRRPVATRAAVSARTSLTPPRFNTRAHASSVAPVVATSSTSTTTPGSGIGAVRHRAGIQAANAKRVAHVLVTLIRRQLNLRGGVARRGAAAATPAGRAVAPGRRPG